MPHEPLGTKKKEKRASVRGNPKRPATNTTPGGIKIVRKGETSGLRIYVMKANK